MTVMPVVEKTIPFSEPSTFALLVDSIAKMTPSEQKLLWIELNEKKLSALAEDLDKSIVPNSLDDEQIAQLVKEARKHGR
jgi:hypothetical protein